MTISSIERFFFSLYFPSLFSLSTMSYPLSLLFSLFLSFLLPPQLLLSISSTHINIRTYSFSSFFYTNKQHQQQLNSKKKKKMRTTLETFRYYWTTKWRDGDRTGGCKQLYFQISIFFIFQFHCQHHTHFLFMQFVRFPSYDSLAYLSRYTVLSAQHFRIRQNKSQQSEVKYSKVK